MAHAQQRPCLVLYGSATGNAEEISRAISEEAPNYGIDARWVCLDQFKKGELTPGSVCVFVVSTTGEGEAPENCSRFMRTIKRKSQKPTMFDGISFTCCGLGDTNYTNFCNTGKFLNKRMCELGAEKFYAECEADEGVGGLEQFIEPWKEGLWGPLRIALGMDEAKIPAAEEAEAPEPAAPKAGGGTAAAPSASRLSLKATGTTAESVDATSDPTIVARQAVASHNGAVLFSAKPTASRRLTTEASAKTVWHMQLDISAAELAEPLQPGDAVGVLVPNPEAEVTDLCVRLGCDAAAIVTLCANEGGGLPSHLPAEPSTVGAILSQCCDLRSTTRKSLLKALATCCTEQAEADALMILASKEGKKDYAVQILEEGPTLLELLKTYPSCVPPVELLFELLAPLAPRYYSLSSSPLGPNGPASIEFAFTVVEYASPSGAKREGLATAHLARIAATVSSGSAAEQSLCCFTKPTPSFHLPEDPATPCVLIGPGTGVAPFVGFAQHRLAQADDAARGKLELYFGCREEKTDFLYRDVLEEAVAGGALGRLVTAFSREQAEKIYVQDRLRDDGPHIAELVLKREAKLYVCGDGGAMFKGVNAALVCKAHGLFELFEMSASSFVSVEILAEHGDMATEDAVTLLKSMGQEGRYLRDVWS